MATTSEALDLKPGARGQRGRKGSDGIEEAIKAAPIKEASKEVMATRYVLHVRRSTGVREAFNLHNASANSDEREPR